MIPLWIIGAGGHAKVVIDAARASGQYELLGCLDDDAERHGETVLGVSVVDHISDTVLEGANAIIAIGNNTARATIAARFDTRVNWVSVVHPSSTIAESALIGAGSAVFAGAIVQPDTVVGRHAILNTGSSVDHDCRLGDLVHVGPGARMAGGVSAGTGSFFGIGSSVIPGIQVGDWATIGAGAVVTRQVLPQCTVVGVPAAPVSKTKAEGCTP